MRDVRIGSTNLTTSLGYWNGQLGMEVVDKTEKSIALRFGENQAQLVLEPVDTMDHATAFGRVAFAVPKGQLPPIESAVTEAKAGKVLTPLVSLDTPGKATVQVVILADPVSL